jgi:hypothetical protein
MLVARSMSASYWVFDLNMTMDPGQSCLRHQLLRVFFGRLSSHSQGPRRKLLWYPECTRAHYTTLRVCLIRISQSDALLPSPRSIGYRIRQPMNAGLWRNCIRRPVQAKRLSVGCVPVVWVVEPHCLHVELMSHGLKDPRTRPGTQPCENRVYCPFFREAHRDICALHQKSS